MPFRDAAAPAAATSATDRTVSTTVAATSPIAIKTRLPMDVSAAVDLAESVCRETSTHLLKEEARNYTDGGRGHPREHPVTGVGVGVDVGNSDKNNDGDGRHSGEEKSNSALSALCSILCEEDVSCRAAATVVTNTVTSQKGGQEMIFPSSDASLLEPQRSAVTDNDKADYDEHDHDQAVEARLAALRVLLHSCRASSSVAHAFAAFDGGTAVQALLGRLCLPTSTGRNTGKVITKNLGV